MATKHTSKPATLRFVRTDQVRGRQAHGRLLKPDEVRGELIQAMERAMYDRAARTPLTEAIHIASYMLPKAFAKPGEAKFKEASDHIMDDYYGPMLSDKSFTEAALDEFISETFAKGYHIDLVEKVAAYCAFAVRAYADEQDSLAWTYIADAQYWTGVVTVAKRHADMPGPATLLAKMKSAKQAKEYAAIEEYWRANIDRKLSAQKAADKIVIAGVTSFSHKKIAEIVSAMRRGETFR